MPPGILLTAMATLRNGAEVIATKPAKGGGFVVLARTRGHHPLVTWFVNDEGEAFNGHYFQEADQDRALRDWEKRR
jgi:hypothetical protein